MRVLATIAFVTAVVATLSAPRPAATPNTFARPLVITARNYAFELRDTIAAGRTRVRLVNAGTEMHHAAIMRLDGGHTFADFLEAVKKPGPPPAWMHDAGGPNTPVPGGAAEVVLDLAPGTYVVTCFIPSPDGMPHFMKGMSRGFTVVEPARVRGAAARATVSVGAPDVTIALSDYAFALSRPLAPGRHVVRVTNDARQSHEVLFVRLAPGKTPQDVAAYVEKMDGPPPGAPIGGTVGMAPGVSNDVLLDLTPGTYAMLCFIPDATDGKPHIAHGMMSSFTVR